jgi:hypothetical protein
MLAFGLPVINGIIAGIIAILFGIVIVTFSCNYLIGIFMLIAGAGWIVGSSLLPGLFWQLGASADGSKRTAICPTASFSGVVRENMPVYAQEIEKRTSPDGISTWQEYSKSFVISKGG